MGMGYEINKCLISRFAVAFILTDVIVGVFAPLQRNVSGSIPVFARKCDTGSCMGFQQCAVYHIVSVNNTFCQSASHLAVVNRVSYLFWIILAFLTTVTTYIINKGDSRELTMNLLEYAVGYRTARFTYYYIGRIYSSVMYHCANQCKGHER